MSPTPFLRWVGGKAGLLAKLAPLLPPADRARGYRQPFLGGGTPFWQVYSAVRPAILSDANPRLIDAYLAVRDHVEPLIAELQRLDPEYGEARYYEIRKAINTGAGSLVERAAMFFVINKWGFNGLWRVNPCGECNVSFGRTSSGKPPMLCDPNNLRACSRALQGVDIWCEDFAVTLMGARAGEAVYIDSPYHPVSKTADFTAYTLDGFSYRAPAQAGLFGGARTDHDRLVDALHELDRRGIVWTLSNADVPEMRAAYARWQISEAKARRSVNTDATKRGPVGEIVVRGRWADRCDDVRP